MSEILTFFTYIKFFVFILSLGLSAFLILRRTVSERRIEILVPLSITVGPAIYVFIINALSHLVPGITAIYGGWILLLALASLITRKKAETLIFPTKNNLVKIISVTSILVLTLFYICSHAPINGSDVTVYYSLASGFTRGDFPLHAPWQPDYVIIYHFGSAEFIGAVREVSQAPYLFIHSFMAFLMLTAIGSLILWFADIRKLSGTPAYQKLIPLLIGFVSLGGFFIAWPTSLQLPNFTEGLTTWISKFPALAQSFEVYGSPADLPAIVYFLHRFMSLGFFFGLCILVFKPTKIYPLFNKLVILVLFAAIALTDETIFFTTSPVLMFIALFNVFHKNIVRTVIFGLLLAIVVLAQGGIISEILLNRYETKSAVLILPEDSPGPAYKYENYRTYRLQQQRGRFFDSSKGTQPFDLYHPGIFAQLGVLTILVIWMLRKRSVFTSEFIYLILLLFGSSLLSFATFHVLVPKGWIHFEGNRFLTLSYFLSGIAIGYFIGDSLNKKKKFLTLLLCWLLVFSIIPPVIKMKNRLVTSNWFLFKHTPLREEHQWIKKNIPISERIAVLTDSSPIPVPNIQLAMEVGAYTPTWGLLPRAHDSFDMSPIYADLFYTINPKIIKELGIKYLVIHEKYTNKLPSQRQSDLNNQRYFSVLFRTRSGESILKVNQKYFEEAKNISGTYQEFSDIIRDRDGKYFMDYPPNITEYTFRILRLLLVDKEHYYNKRGAFYNARIDVDLKYFGDKADWYDYLVLGKEVDPKSICNCDAILLWEGNDHGLKLWQTIKP